MDKSSIDGRRKNKNAVAPQVRLLRKSDTETPTSLRPASPPKSNPWSSTKKPPAASLAGMFPPLPKPQSLWSPEKMTNAGASREPSTLSNESRLGDDMAQPTLSTRSFSPVSNSSSTTRQLFEAAAPRATENLWKTPFGADVLVRTGDILLKVHRNIVVPQSGWFRDNLPPPNLDGTPVTVDLRFAPEAVAHCLRFIYTGKIEICEFDQSRPWYSSHIPRCVLAYTAAIYLRMARMAKHLLRVVENTSIEIGSFIRRHYLHRDIDCSSWVQFSWHYQTALEVIVREQPQKLMVPMRLAMASILDAMLFWLARQPLFVSELKSSWWRIMQMSMPDIAEYKRLCRTPDNYNSPLPSEMALREMFEEMKPGYERETTKSVATQTGDNPENTVSVGDPRYYFPVVHRGRRVSL
ncbi:hypothetical protein FPOAC2_01232 [Fusarium poae]|uniref:BTB domain-containing protein n=1 Tax=Fusarium poae TaxID=36050 RepID=A0A1B8B230_FUSPO|nr:hypothetical protein FPOAC1_001162 [Fusarium poae]KAG8675185.1 hypothetical protein FPOAC1_001162 [Fusarium poae]OBS26777.1 hypothetical protein FPOA_00720 [Fusarium poae]